jgi:hypothetical protein
MILSIDLNGCFARQSSMQSFAGDNMPRSGRTGLERNEQRTEERFKAFKIISEADKRGLLLLLCHTERGWVPG